MRAAKQRALERDMTLGGLMEDALRATLDQRSSSPATIEPLPISSRHGGTRPGVEIADGARLRDVMDEA